MTVHVRSKKTEEIRQTAAMTGGADTEASGVCEIEFDTLVTGSDTRRTFVEAEQRHTKKVFSDRHATGNFCAKHLQELNGPPYG